MQKRRGKPDICAVIMELLCFCVKSLYSASSEMGRSCESVNADEFCNWMGIKSSCSVFMRKNLDCGMLPTNVVDGRMLSMRTQDPTSILRVL